MRVGEAEEGAEQAVTAAASAYKPSVQAGSDASPSVHAGGQIHPRAGDMKTKQVETTFLSSFQLCLLSVHFTGLLL